MDKIRFESLTDKSKLDAQPELFIRIVPDKANKTLSIIDSGIGMTKAGILFTHHVTFLNSLIFLLEVLKFRVYLKLNCLVFVRFGEQFGYHCKVWNQGVHGGASGWG